MPATLSTRSADSTDVSGKPVKVRVVELASGPYRVELHDVEGFAHMWGLLRGPFRRPNRAMAIRTLSLLGIPILDMPDGHTYYNPAELIKVFAILTRLGGPGFFAPGCRGKGNSYYKRCGYRAAVEVTPEMLKFYGRGIEAELLAETRRKDKEVTKRVRKLARKAGRDLTIEATAAPATGAGA